MRTARTSYWTASGLEAHEPSKNQLLGLDNGRDIRGDRGECGRSGSLLGQLVHDDRLPTDDGDLNPAGLLRDQRRTVGARHLVA